MKSALRPAAPASQCLAALMALVSTTVFIATATHAANTVHDLTAGTVWSTSTWSNGTPSSNAGDIAELITAATNFTTSLDTNVTIGELQIAAAATTSTWTITAGGGTFTLDGTGITSGNQAFGNAGVAAIAGRGTGAWSIAAPISFGTTALDVGSTAASNLTISGAITATATQSLNIRDNSTGTTTLSGPIGATGSTINISNLGTSTGAATITGALGANVGSVLQNSSGSSLTLNASNTAYVGNTTLQLGTLILSNANALGTGGTGTFTINGGTTLNAGAAITLASTQAESWNGNITYTSNSLNLGTGAVTLNGNNVGIISNTTNSLTVGGNISNGTSSSGATSLTKTAQANGSFTNMGALILNGTNSYTGGTIIQQGQVQFGSAASVPGTGSILLAPQGPNSVNYEGAAAVFSFALTQTQLGKLGSASVGTAALSTASSNALDFSSATGANLANVSLGAQTSSTYSGTLTPWTSANNGAYQLGGSGNQSASNNSTLTVSSVLANSGSVATGLIVDPAFVGFGAGTVSLTGVNTYTGTTRVNTGTLKLDFSGNAGTGVTNLVSSSSTLAMANFGTLNLTGKSANTNSQTFNGLTLLGSNSTITAAQNGATGLTANFGAITRSSNGTLTFSALPTTGNFTTTNSLDGSSGGGILGAWATVGTGTSTRYATKSGSNVASYSAGTAAATGANLTDTTGLVNYDVAATGALPGAASLNTLRYTGAAGNVDIGANNLTLNGVLNAGTGAFTVTTASTGTVVIGATKELVLNSANQAIFINAPIVDNAAGASSVTITGNSGGQFAVLQKTSTYTGGTFINGNIALQAATGGFGASTGLVTFSGGQLNAETTAITLANPLFFTQGTSTTLNPNNQNLTLTGAVTGSGTIFVGDGGSFASLAMNGDNSGFTGTVIFNPGGNSGDAFNMGGSASANNFSQGTLLFENTGTRRFSISGGTMLQIGAIGGAAQWIGGGTAQIGALNTNSSTNLTPITNALALVKVGTGTLTLIGSSGWSPNGGVTVNNGTLLVDMSTLGTPTNYLASAGLTLNGGTMSILGKATTLQNSSQAFSGTTINPGASIIKVNNNLGSTGNTIATLAGLTRTTTVGTAGGGTVDFVLPTGTQSATNGITTTSTTNVLGGIMTQANVNSIAYATVNQTDWAALSTNNIVALSSYTTGSLSGNVDMTTSFTGAASAAPNSLRFNTDAQTLTLGTGTQVVTGGILVTANSNSTGSTITGNTLTTGGGREFVFIDYGKLTVASQLVNNAGGSTMLTKSGTGTLFLTNTNNTYSGINYLNAGVTNIAAAASLGTSTAANAISFNGGTLQLAGSFNLNSTQGINLGFNSGTFDTNGFSSTYGGAIASSSAVQGTTAENTAGQFGFTKAGAGTLTLTGTNTYAGATSVTGGTLSVSYLDNATTAGNVTPGAAGGIGKSSNYAKNLVLNGGTLQYTGATASTDRLFTLGDSGGGLEASGSGAVNFTNTGAVGYQINSTGAATNSSPVLTLGGTNTGANTLAATIGNNGLGTTSITKSGAGTWVLSGANTYTGTTSVTAGTLALGANNVFGATNFALGGGTLAVGTFNNSKVGTLSLTANSAITLGSGGVFAFADSSALNWGGNTLSITGTFVDGASIRFGTGSGGLTGTQLSLISINGGAAAIDTSGFLVSAVPEPATYAVLAGLAGLGLAACRRRRA